MSSLAKKLNKLEQQNPNFRRFKRRMNKMMKRGQPQSGLCHAEAARRLRIVAAMEEGLVALDQKFGSVHPGEQDE